MMNLFRGERVDGEGLIEGDLQHNEIGDTWISRLTSDIHGNGGYFENVKWDTVEIFLHGKWILLSELENRCFWHEDKYTTSCGETFRGISKSGFKFCPFCGQPIMG